MTQRKDDGSFVGGFVMAIACLLCFFGGYWLRDLGFQFHIQQQEPTEQIEKP